MTGEKEGGWIEWAGGECPVGASIRVDVRFRDEPDRVFENERADYWLWQHVPQREPGDPEDDIISYRIVDPQP